MFGFHASLPRIKRRQPKPDNRMSASKIEGEKDDHEPKEKEQKLDPGAVFSYVPNSQSEFRFKTVLTFRLVRNRKKIQTTRSTSRVKRTLTTSQIDQVLIKMQRHLQLHRLC